MLIGKRTYYFIKILLFFAFSKKQSFSIKEISKRAEISEKVLEQVLLMLKNKGVLASKRGPQGGYRLLEEIHSMSIMDIVKLADGKIDIVVCEKDNRKVIDSVIYEMTQKIEKEICKKLNGVTIKDLTGQMKEKIAGKGFSYSI